MVNRIAIKEDFPACNEFIAKSGYYAHVDVSDLGGLVYIVEDAEEIAGLVWIGVSGRIAYLDYLCIDPKYPGLAMRLLRQVRVALRDSGVKQVRYCIYASNLPAIKIATAFGGINDFPYVMGCVNLEAADGN